MTIHWKAVEQYFTVVLLLWFVFQLNPVCNVGKFIIFGFGTVRSERLIKSLKFLLSKAHPLDTTEGNFAMFF